MNENDIEELKKIYDERYAFAKNKVDNSTSSIDAQYYLGVCHALHDFWKEIINRGHRRNRCNDDKKNE